MKVDRDELIQKLADQATDSADIDSLMSYFHQGQIDFLDEMTDKDLISYANEFLGYDVEEEGL